jgi:uncharacterized protein (UPF0276 family)
VSDRFGLLFDDAFADDLAGVGERLDFLEVIPDRYFGAEPPLIPTGLPVTMHSLNLSLGTQEPLDQHYVGQLRASAQHFKPIWASDHLAVSHVGGMDLGMLSPVRCSAAAAARIADKVSALQDELRIPFLVENIASYIRLSGNEFSELELLDRVVRASGCGLLLDINNVVVNAANHGWDPYAYLRYFPLHAVREIHIAGHHEESGVHLDSHAEPVGEQVWKALRFVAQRIGPVSILLERDDNIPPFNDLLVELTMARRVVQASRPAPAGKCCA